MIKVKDLVADTIIESQYLVLNISQGISNSNSLYLNLILGDNSGQVTAKVWDYDVNLMGEIQVGEVYNFEATVIVYRDNLQLKITSFTLVEKYNLEDFLVASEIPLKVLTDKLFNILATVQNKNIKLLGENLIDKYYDRFINFPAGVKNHHNYLHGLLEHSIYCAETAILLTSQYTFLNRDLVVVGALIHDLGKVIELSSPVACHYTKKGKLLNHLNILAQEIHLEAYKLGIIDSEEALFLKHIALSHHGKPEYGAAIMPMIAEAEMVHFIDNLDARMNALYKEFKVTDNNSFTNRMYALENRQFFKFDLGEEEDE